MMREDTAIREQGELRHKVRKTQGVDGKANVDSEHLRVKRAHLIHSLPDAQHSAWSMLGGAQLIIAESMSLIG